jgi:hypothetical protein
MHTALLVASLATASALRVTVPSASAAPAAPAVQEVWLDPLASSCCLGEAIQAGNLVLALPGVANAEELQTMFHAALDASRSQTEGYIAAQAHELVTGRSRMYVPEEVPTMVPLCEEILLRVLDRVDEEMPEIFETLFRPCEEWASRQPLNAQGLQPTCSPPLYLADTSPSLRELYSAGELEYSEGEPAINVYTSSGYFGAHKDHLALTMLMPLTSPTEDFSGGGTGFWAGGRRESEDPDGAPATVLAPPPGTALLFGGDVTHAGMAVDAGVRSVFVASFSTRTTDSRTDRVQGLLAPTPISTAGQAVGAAMAIKPPEPSAVRTSPSGEAGPRTARERMVELQELLASDLLTQEEYDEKRQQILRSL